MPELVKPEDRQNVIDRLVAAMRGRLPDELSCWIQFPEHSDGEECGAISLADPSDLSSWSELTFWFEPNDDGHWDLSVPQFIGTQISIPGDPIDEK